MENENTTMENENINESVEGSKKGKDFKIEIALFLILGFLLGVMIKTEAAKNVTIGFNDYKVAAMSHGYDINQIQEDLAAKQKEAAEAQAKAAQEQQEQQGQQQEQQEENKNDAADEQADGSCGI